VVVVGTVTGGLAPVGLRNAATKTLAHFLLAETLLASADLGFGHDNVSFPTLSWSFSF